MHRLLRPWSRTTGGLMLAATLLASIACARAPTPPTSTGQATPPSISNAGKATSTQPAPSAGIADPFGYCKQVGTIDAPDARYTGERVPTSIAEGIRRASDGAPGAPLDVFVRGTSWRCVDGKVYACTVGANLPCGEKADASRAPSAAVVEFCRTSPDADVIPAAVTGRATVYQWRCTATEPAIVRQVFEADSRGFIAAIWYEIKPS